MTVNLTKEFFPKSELLLLTHGDISVTAFRYKSGVCALKVQNTNGYFILLPFKGQQLWDIVFGGKSLKMKGTVPEPLDTTDYLRTYGGFMYHCGISAFGVPQQDDTHPLHGETPNIAYDNAFITCSEDENGKYVILGGTLDYNIAFTRHYKFSPSYKLYENGSIIKVGIELSNLRSEDMEYMYLCHINFAPENSAKLIYSANRDSEHIKVHKRIGAGVEENKAKALMGYMEMLSKDPGIMDEVGAPGQLYDPEICFAINYESDENGRAYTMQYKKGEGACFVSHPVDALPVGVRWISRTASEDAMGMILPATAEHLGYHNAERNGQIKVLKGNESISFYLEVGYLDDKDAGIYEKKIDKILGL